MILATITGYCAIGLATACAGLVQYLKKNRKADIGKAAIAALIVGAAWIITIPLALIMAFTEPKGKQ